MMISMIVDNEPLTRAHVRQLLEAEGVDVVGEAAGGAAALKMIQELRPDLLLIGIEMSGLNGLQLASALLQIDPAPLLVFVTDRPDHAIAFEHGALDCLVKPVSPDRLAAMLVRARARLAEVRARGSNQEPVAAAPQRRRLPVRIDYVLHLLPVEEITCAMARQRRTIVRTKTGEYPTHYSLTQLLVILPREQFLRIHDSWLVNLNEVKELIFLGNHSYEVRLSDDQRCPVSRARYPELRRALGLVSRL